MATFTAAAALAGAVAAGDGLHYNVKAAVGSVEIGTAITSADSYSMCKVPKGAVVIGGWLYGDDIDTATNEALDLDIGWLGNGTDTADPDGFGNLGDIVGDAITNWKTEVGILYPLQGVLMTGGPKLFSAETTLSVACADAATAGGTGTLTLVALYVVDENFVKTSV